MKDRKALLVLTVALALFSITTPSAFADVDVVTAPRMGSDGLHAIAWGIAAAGLFVGVGLAIGRRK